MANNPNEIKSETHSTGVSNLLHKELILVGVEAANWQEVLTLLADQLYQAGYVHESYLQAVLNRER
ncbi:MAG TPA: PTS sugar transporter subunit IIA, partial [Methanofastidiosum sp.]|nr:PTS sugar transporter subunit IIA [Methanofastidiosum sp.]